MRIIAKRQILRNLGDGKNLTMPVPGPVADSAGKRPTQIVLIVILAVLAFITEFGFIARPKAVGTTHFRFESIGVGGHTPIPTKIPDKSGVEEKFRIEKGTE